MMSRTGRVGLYLIAAVVAVVIGLAVGSRSSTQAVDPTAERALASVGLTDLEGNAVRLDRWAGKTVVVNFWATWCAPCREEIPGLIAVHREIESGQALVVGVAIDGAPKVAAFAREYGIPYPVLIGGAPMLDVLRVVGNPGGALPYTVIVAPDGRIVARHLGLLQPADLRRMLRNAVS